MLKTVTRGQIFDNIKKYTEIAASGRRATPEEYIREAKNFFKYWTGEEANTVYIAESPRVADIILKSAYITDNFTEDIPDNLRTEFEYTVSPKMIKEVYSSIKKAIPNVDEKKMKKAVRFVAGKTIYEENSLFRFIFNSLTSTYMASFAMSAMELLGEKTELMLEAEKLLKLNIWGMFILKNTAIVIMPPLPFNLDKKGLASDSILKWSDGTIRMVIKSNNTYMRIPPPIDEKIINKTLTLKDILSIENVDLRFGVLNYVGLDKFIQNSELISKDEFGEIRKIPFADNLDIWVLVYPDIDGHGIRVKACPKEVLTKDKKVIKIEKPVQALAYFHHITVEEYIKSAVPLIESLKELR